MTMKFKPLGRTELTVSSLCMGTMTFGREADRKTSAAMFNRCREAGINFFDCADLYAMGEAERILGELIASSRDELIVTSKVYYALEKGLKPAGLSRTHILKAVEDSLTRLKTDRIDVYFLHHFDAGTPLEETLGALDELVRQGKVRFIGASNFAAWQVEKAMGISDCQKWARFSCIQPMYNLVKRQAEVELLPMARAESLGVVVYSPLGGGLLSGKYADDGMQGRLSTDDIYRRRYGEMSAHETARNLALLAEERGIDPVSLAVAWVMKNPAVTAPIIGARNVEQLESSLAATGVAMTEDLYAAVSRLSPGPPPATDRSEETAD